MLIVSQFALTQIDFDTLSELSRVLNWVIITVWMSLFTVAEQSPQRGQGLT